MLLMSRPEGLSPSGFSPRNTDEIVVLSRARTVSQDDAYQKDMKRVSRNCFLKCSTCTIPYLFT